MGRLSEGIEAEYFTLDQDCWPVNKTYMDSGWNFHQDLGKALCVDLSIPFLAKF